MKHGKMEKESCLLTCITLFMITIVTAFIGIYLLNVTIIDKNARIGLGLAALLESSAALCLFIAYIKKQGR